MRTFPIGAPAAYPSYRLYITEDNDDRTGSPIVVVSIGELYLTGT